MPEATLQSVLFFKRQILVFWSISEDSSRLSLRIHLAYVGKLLGLFRCWRPLCATMALGDEITHPLVGLVTVLVSAGGASICVARAALRMTPIQPPGRVCRRKK
jgi:hypothetical protein